MSIAQPVKGIAASAVILAGLMLSGGVGRAGELIVVEARGVQLHAGQVIDDSQKLTLTEGQRVTLIAANGNTLKLRGPYDQVPTEAGSGGADLGQALQALIAQKQTRTSEVGVVRNGGDGAALPDPWVLDITRPGNLCVREGAEIIVWRPSGKAAANLAITSTDRSWKVTATWPAGEDRLSLPKRFPSKNRATYVVALGGVTSAVTLYDIPPSVDQDKMQAAWMIEKGCLAQADAYVKALQ
jgi:hypothetical protein